MNNSWQWAMRQARARAIETGYKFYVRGVKRSNGDGWFYIPMDTPE